MTRYNNSCVVLLRCYPSTCKVTMTIYDAAGREVARLLNRQQGPGSFTVTWDAHSAASGVYICRLQAEGRTREKRIVYLK